MTIHHVWEILIYAVPSFTTAEETSKASCFLIPTATQWRGPLDSLRRF